MPPNIRLSNLRAALAKLLQRAEVGQPEEDILHALDRLMAGLKGEQVMPVLVKVAAEAPVDVQAWLEALLPQWLKAHSYQDTLLTMLERGRLEIEESVIAKTWLVSSGISRATVDTAVEEKAAEEFLSAYTLTDEFGSQGVVIVLWYTDEHHRHGTGMNFLIDYNPPWEGAVKDIDAFPMVRIETLLRNAVDRWATSVTAPAKIGAAQAKLEILQALEHNREERIRLPSDLVKARSVFIEHILRLPDTPETPTFTSEDFDRLSQEGTSVESLRHHEQTVARRVRMENGEEILFLGSDLD